MLYDTLDGANSIRIVQGTVGVVLNTLAWLVILRTKSLHNMTNYLLAYLAVVDSMFCTNLFLVNVMAENQGQQSFIGGEIYCRIVGSGFTFILTIYSSSFGLCLVTYERYIGIVHPLHYPRMMSPKKVIMIIFIALGMSILFSSSRLFIHNANNDTNHPGCELTNLHVDMLITLLSVGNVLFVLFGNLLPILFMGWVYYKIQATLKRSAQHFQQQNVQGAALNLLQARQNVISMLRIVMGAVVVLWTPIDFLLIICLPVNPMMKWCYTNSAQTLITIFNVVSDMNSVINPIIYVFKYKKFRKGLQDMLCCCIGRPLRPNRIVAHITMNERNVLDQR